MNLRNPKERRSQNYIRSKSPAGEAFDRLLKLAEYEVTVDTYRGMQLPSERDNPWKKCIWGNTSTTYSSSTDTGGGGATRQLDSDKDNHNSAGIVAQTCHCCCPSLISWTLEAHELQLREARTRRGKRKRINATVVAGDCIEPITCTPSNNGPYLGRRREDSKVRYSCDYNPFCLGSLGGAMGDVLSKSDMHVAVDGISALEDTVMMADHQVDANITLRNDNSVTVESLTETPSQSQFSANRIIDVNSSGAISIDNKGDSDETVVKIMNSEGGCNDHHDSPKDSANLDAVALNKDIPTLTERSDENDEPPQYSVNTHAGTVYSEEVEDELQLDPQKGSSVYSKETAEQLSKVRKSLSVNTKSVRAHILQRVLRPLSNKRNNMVIYDSQDTEDHIEVNCYIDKLRQRHASLLFSNPLKAIDSSRSQVAADVKLSIPPGIHNLGATCYLNSQLQCLAQNLAFLNGIFSWREPLVDDTNRIRNGRMHVVLLEMQQLLARIVYGAECTITAKEFSNALGIETDEMQDPNEFARLLLERIHETFQQCAQLEGNESGQRTRDLANLLPNIFHGETTYQTTCLECLQSSKRSEGFMDLNLPIVPKSIDTASRKGSNYTNVQDCLNSYTRAELLNEDNQYWCDRCQKKQDAKREVKFRQLPPVLNIQLSRYVFDRKKFVKKKLRDKVLLPRVLFVPHDNKKRKEAPQQHANTEDDSIDEASYLLCSVLKHRGASAYHGHYISEAMDWQTGTWYEFNDDKVTMLSGGPSSAYTPSRSSETSKHSDLLEKVQSKDIPARLQGCADAYNLYYVDASFFAKCVEENISRKQICNETNSREKPSHNADDKKRGEIDIHQTISIERGERYGLLSEMCLNDANIAKRLQRRRSGILRFMFEQQSSSAMWQMYDEHRWRSSVWVKGDMLRKFLRCKDDLEGIINNLPGTPLLCHKHLLCKHGKGLHPRVAREGKLLPREVYNSYVALLLGEQKMLTTTDESTAGKAGSSIQRDGVVNDCIITPGSNLFCQSCADSYRKELARKIEDTKRLRKLYEVLDPKNDAFGQEVDTTESMKNEDKQYTFAVTRRFITNFRSIFSKIMKKVETSAEVEMMTSGRKDVNACMCEGLDTIDLSEFSSERYLEHSVKQSGGDQLDLSVNGSITCDHGKCDALDNKRIVRHVPSRVWQLIKLVFPFAVPHKRFIDGEPSTECNQCKECAVRRQVEDERKSQGLQRKSVRKSKGGNRGSDSKNSDSEYEVDLAKKLVSPTRIPEDQGVHFNAEKEPSDSFSLHIFEIELGANVEAAISTIAQNQPDGLVFEPAIDGVRRSSRKRKTKYPKGSVLREDKMGMGYHHNIAALRLFLYEKCPGFPIDQDLTIVVPLTSQSNTANDERLQNAENHVDLEGKVKSASSPIMMEIPYEWNHRTLKDIFDVAGVGGTDYGNSDGPILLRQTAVEEKGGRNGIVAKREQNELLMDSLLEMANISSIVENASSTQMEGTIQKEKVSRRVEKGFQGTLLHSSLGEASSDTVDKCEPTQESTNTGNSSLLPEDTKKGERSERAVSHTGENSNQRPKIPCDETQTNLVVILDQSDSEVVSDCAEGNKKTRTRLPVEYVRNPPGSGLRDLPIDVKLDDFSSSSSTGRVDSSNVQSDLIKDITATTSNSSRMVSLPCNQPGSTRRLRKDDVEAEMFDAVLEAVQLNTGKSGDPALCRKAVRWARRQHPDAGIEELKDESFVKYLIDVQNV